MHNTTIAYAYDDPVTASQAWRKIRNDRRFWHLNPVQRAEYLSPGSPKSFFFKHPPPRMNFDVYYEDLARNLAEHVGWCCEACSGLSFSGLWQGGRVVSICWACDGRLATWALKVTKKQREQRNLTGSKEPYDFYSMDDRLCRWLVSLMERAVGGGTSPAWLRPDADIKAENVDILSMNERDRGWPLAPQID